MQKEQASRLPRSSNQSTCLCEDLKKASARKLGTAKRVRTHGATGQSGPLPFLESVGLGSEPPAPLRPVNHRAYTDSENIGGHTVTGGNLSSPSERQSSFPLPPLLPLPMEDPVEEPNITRSNDLSVNSRNL
ncbi:unnamed protein product, partial [Durusdinium trenchii]